MPRAIIFDLNGVFIKSEPLSERFERDFGVDRERFLPALSHIMDVARKPDAPGIYGLFEPDLGLWGVRMDEKAFLDYWFSAEHADEEMIGYARELKRDGVRLFVLSNNFRERTAHYRATFPFLEELFDDVRFSHETGLLKPDPRCFTSILEKHGLRAQECLYFDDSEKNVMVAKGLGIDAHRYEGAAAMRAVIGECRLRP